MTFRFSTGKLFPAFLFSFFLNIHHAFCGQTSQKIWIGLTDPDDIYNETMVTFLEEATDAEDAQYDSRKLNGNASFDIYSKIGTDDFKVQALPLLTGDKTVLLAIDAVYSGTYRLRLANLSNVDESLVIVLEDTQTGAMQNLRAEPIYIFNLTSGVNIQRFKLHFYPPVGIAATDITCSGNAGAIQMTQPGSHTWSYEVKDEGDAVIDTGINWSGTKTIGNLDKGSFSIRLKDVYGYEFTKQVVVSGVEPVIAQFESSEEEIEAGETIRFFDYSSGALNLIWNFGDGAVLNGASFPAHTYAEPGTYLVMCTALNTECSDAMTKTITVNSPFTSVNTLEQNDFAKVYAYGSELIVRFEKPQYGFADVQVFNLLGQTVINEKVVAIGERHFPVEAKQGCFLVRVALNQSSIERKIYISR